MTFLPTGILQTHVLQSALLPFLECDPIRNVFPLFVCSSHPEGLALAAVQGETLVGCLVSGDPFRMFSARSGWLVAATPEVAECLMEAAGPDLWRVGIQCERAIASQWAKRLPGCTVTHDLYMAISPHAAEFTADSVNGQVLRLDSSNLDRMPLAGDIRQVLGNPLDYPAGAPLYGLWRRGEIVAVAETFVRYGQVLSIQQVYTASAHRGRGAARALVGAITRSAGKNGFTSTYLVEETNGASVRLARGLGFEVVWELACIVR